MLVAASLRDKISALKEQGCVQSNLYTRKPLDCADESVVTGKTVLFSCMDHTVRRLYYFTRDFSDMCATVGQLSHGEYTLELMSRDPAENRLSLLQTGFTPYSRLMRLSVSDCSASFQNSEISSYHDERVGLYPKESEAGEINQLLWRVFDPRVSHLLTDEEIVAAIQRREITIHRDEHAQIKAILQAVVNPKKFYINQIYNGTEKKIIHAMLLNRLKSYTDAGGKYAYAWVAEDNAASMRFHKKYGFTHDGMWNLVYRLEKTPCYTMKE